jgi:hypothetical protein
MNPFTASLLARIQDPPLARFVSAWDALEALVARVYRGGAATDADEAEHRRLRAWLAARYPEWRGALAAWWPLTRVGREPTRADPFAAILTIESAAGFVDNWAAMQTLPAAREALNRLLIDAAGAGGAGGAPALH